ncbi:hypothetical protein SASPL_114515 [Salvia splendens]|uniref:Uncharacterized protein n=1 Tax=Salvia splendens TaxID=180675 RepID=A0A8X8Y1G7_SALSN|nr:uncharacterized protein LOC121804941 isoform X2 [Salvia splendens]KAG6424103.1 hypothetical protein SASPL_114515 [Salvia splendens]
MPGTIHVTVLEFKGVSSSPKPSAKSLKVSMGKRQYQTWDKGHFSFPITRIRENIVVALLDAGGNEIAHQDIRTMQIIEKGSWDEVFSINGGGHVHLKLDFTLSQDERNRIRVMRESAMKKKLEANPSINLRFLEAVASSSMKDELQISASTKGFVEIDITTPKVEASQAGSSLTAAASSSASLFSHQMGKEPVVDIAIPNATDGIQDTPSSPVEHEINVESAQVSNEKIEAPRIASVRSESKDGPSSDLPRSSISEKNSMIASKLQDDLLVQKPQKQVPVRKTPSNVRKMISAFETVQVQEVKSMKRAASVPSQLNISSKERLLEDRVSPAEQTSTDSKDPNLRNLHKQPTMVSGKVLSKCEPSQVENSSVDIRRQLASETATISGRTDEEQSQHSFSRLVKSSAAEGSGRGRGTGLKNSSTINAQVASNLKRKTLDYYNKEEYDSAQTSGMWIFPDNTSRLCITTACEQDMKIVGHYNNKAKTHQANSISSEKQKNSMHEKEQQMGKNSKKLFHQPESGSSGSPSDSFNGLVRQVIKVAAIVGFGVLVLMTRQKEPWRNHKEDKDKDKDNLFHIPDYVDEGTLKPWTGKP